MRNLNALSVAILFSFMLFSGCHKADKVLYPISRAAEDLNSTTVHFSLPVKELPFAEIRFKQHSLVLEKKF